MPPSQFERRAAYAAARPGIGGRGLRDSVYGIMSTPARDSGTTSFPGKGQLSDCQRASRLPVLMLGAEAGSSPDTPDLWKREYQLRAVSLSEVHSTPTRSHPHLVLCGGPDQLRFMPAWPEDSVRLFVDWDETFLPRLAGDIATRPQVAELIRNYPIQSSGWLELLPNASVAVREARSSPGGSVRFGARSWVAGLIVAKRKAQVRRKLRRAGIRVNEVALGYTHMFVAGVKDLAKHHGWRPLREEESLLAYLAEHAPLVEGLKKTDLAYVGQRGKFQRQRGIDTALAMGYAIGPVRSGYGGQGASPTEDISITYVNAMAATRFALCPPGNYAGDSFRFGEVLLLGALPVEVSRVISEPGRRHMRDLQEHTVTAPTWREALTQMSRMSESERLQRVAAARSAYVARLAAARSILRDGA